MGLPHHFTTLRFQSECVNKKISTKKKIKKKNKQEKAEENESFPAHLEANGHMTHLAETVFLGGYYYCACWLPVPLSPSDTYSQR